MSGSISFDRAADFYDKTRRLPDAAMSGVIDMLSAELQDRGPVLEIGVGTGRIALPLASRGIPMFGVDLSTQMLARLREKERTTSVHLAVADATLLPLAEGTFGAAVVCHVFHLIPNWRDAVAELARVVAAGGTIAVEIGGADKPFKDVTEELQRRAELEKRHIGLDIWNDDGAAGELAAAFARYDVTHRELPRVPLTYSETIEHVIRLFEDGMQGWTWSIEPERRAAIARDVRAWAAAKHGPLDREITIERSLTWHAFDVPLTRRSP